MSTFNFITVAGTTLKPAPYVSTSYEYNKMGETILGGFLIVTLSGTLIGEDIISQMDSLSQMQASSDCVNIIIGCSGGSQFLNGSGRIRSIDISPSDQPFMASYSMQIAVETSNSRPIVEPDSTFLSNNCLSNVQYLQSYSESISVQGEGASLSNGDSGIGVSKSYAKASGQISVSCYGRNICGVPDFNGIQAAVDIVQQRANALMSLNACVGQGGQNPLSNFSGWSKWLDTKKLDIDTGSGTVTWSFDLYMSKGGCSPSAWVDITTEDKKDQKKNMRIKKISGTIRGLSSSTGNYLGEKTGANERMSNAMSAWSRIQGMFTGGNWPGDDIVLSGTEGTCQAPNACNQAQVCYQRLSSSVTKSVVSGEITFSAEFGDISSCKPNGGIGSIDVTVEVSNPAAKIVEIVVPNGVKTVVQQVGDTPAKATVSAKGTLSGCDTTKMNDLKNCVNREFNLKAANFNGWLLLKNKESIGTFSYSRTREYIRCG